MTRLVPGIVALLLLIGAPISAAAQTPPAIHYEVRFPAAEHHWMEVDLTVRGLDDEPVDLRMSRASPGRYAVHEFAKNVFLVEARDGRQRPLPIERPGVDVWRVGGHDGTVTMTYRIFGDHADGTYMAVDTTHAHLNMPAAFMWVEGLELRPITIVFEPPEGSGWTAATQLFPTADPFTFTAPNLQYFLDSPVELAPLVRSQFTLAGPDGTPVEIRLAVHGEAAQADVDALAGLVEAVVAEQRAVFGELPAFDPGFYTFLIDTVNWAAGDGMEHRNSTVITRPGTPLGTPEGRRALLDVIAHEFFHVWNVERIRPAGLEPFDFTRQNVTCCLWLAEGFTQYYGPLTLYRAGLADRLPVDAVVTVANSAAHGVRSAVEMSEHAPFADAGIANDADDRSRTFISYYTHGAALALALDLSLRDRSDHRISLDDYMRDLWQSFGRPADARPGYVARPYSLADLRTALARVAGDQAFADAFFDRYVEGREVPDFAPLLARAGYRVETAPADRGWTGPVPLSEVNAGLLVGAGRFALTLVPFETPAYRAGLDRGDLIVSVDGQPATLARWADLSRRPPGTEIPLLVERRDGTREATMLTLGRDPTIRVTDMGREDAGGQRFRAAWLGSQVDR